MFRCFCFFLLLSFSLNCSAFAEIDYTVSSRMNKFAIDLYKNIKDKEGNLFCSPFSISAALYMTYAGTRGETAKQMEKVLYIDVKDNQLHLACKKLLDLLISTEKYELMFANALWGENSYVFLPEFKEFIYEYYSGAFEPLDFRYSPEPARLRINKWVEDKTNEKIKDLIPSGNITADTRLVLTNAVYFKSAWALKFSKMRTRFEDFFLSAGTPVKRKFMNKTDRYPYFETDTAQILQLSYTAEDLSMYIVLPKSVDGIKKIEETLGKDFLDKMLSNHLIRKVSVSMPKFTITDTFNLHDHLKTMGMPLAFSDLADFSGISKYIKEQQNQLKISAVIHKAFIEVDEKGTEAAAATGVMMKAGGLAEEVPVVRFNADHPFMFFIVHNKTKTILFMGKVVNPKN